MAGFFKGGSDFRQGLLGDGALNNQRRVEFPDILFFKIWTFAAQED